MVALPKARAQEIEGMSAEWGVEEWLHSTRARITMIKKLSSDAKEAMTELFQALWPDEAIPETIRDLARHLSDAQECMIEWRESAAHVGADETLSWLLSCYETLELEKVIEARQKKA